VGILLHRLCCVGDVQLGQALGYRHNARLLTMGPPRFRNMGKDGCQWIAGCKGILRDKAELPAPYALEDAFVSAS
jgi:hypothetical protein